MSRKVVSKEPGAVQFIWEPHEAQWEEMYLQLAEYKSKYGDCDVSRSYIENPQLATWVNGQRSNYREAILDQYRIEKLEALDFVWDFTEVLESKWEEMFKRLVDYKEQYGHCRVPTHYRKEPELGQWVGVQRQTYRAGKLRQDRVAKLTELGFAWHKHDAVWEQNYQRLVEYKKRHGHCNPPRQGKTTKLGSWVHSQRRFYKTGTLSSDKIEKLNSIEFAWDTLETQWEEMYQELIDYHSIHGNCNVPKDYSRNPQLSMWVAVQRTSYKKDGLEKDRIEKLEKLGFVWDLLEARWEDRYQRLSTYRNKHGDCNVPPHYSEDPQLGYWVDTQRSRYKQNKLSQDRIKKLEELDFIWESPLEDRWKEMCQALFDYKEEYGDCCVSINYSDNAKLGRWVSTQRQEYRKGKLSEVKVSILKDLDFEWNEIDARWTRRYKELLDYFEEHGDCNVPSTYQQNKKLSNWVTVQRTNYKEGFLSEEKVKKLENIGFSWSFYIAKEDQWNTMYQELIEYKKEHGDCDVPAKYSENVELGKWVTQQRQAYKGRKAYSLSKDKIKKLENEGFVWDSLEFQWEQRYQELIRYKKKYGSLVLDKEANTQLKSWLNVQRQSYKKGTLSQDRIAKLELIGIEWEPKNNRWEQRFQELVDYRNLHGNCNVPQDIPDNPSLGSWVSHLRDGYKRRILSEERIARLETLGFEWEPHKRK